MDFFIVKMLFNNGNSGYCVDTAYDSYHANAVNAEKFSSESEAKQQAKQHMTHFRVSGYYQIEKISQ